MGRAGFIDGSVHAQNLQGGSISKVLGGTGTDTVAVTFRKKMKALPYIVVSNTSGTAVTRTWVSGKTNSGFTLNIVTSSLTSGATFDYHAYDDRYN